MKLEEEITNRISQIERYREQMRKLVIERPLYQDEVIRLETAIIIEQELKFLVELSMIGNNKCKVHGEVKNMDCKECQSDIAYIIWKRLG